MPKRFTSGFPDFTFPVVAWAPELASGDWGDDGTRRFLNSQQLTTTCFPESELRLGWEFVDLQGRCWVSTSSKVVGRADPWIARLLPQWLYSPSYRLALKFTERPPMPFDAVRKRLLAAIETNPRHYGRGYCKMRREELEAAETLEDVVKPDWLRAMERSNPDSVWWEWPTGQGRCSRLSFGLALVVTAAAILAAILLISRIFPLALALWTFAFLLFVLAIFRRLHDLGHSAWQLFLFWIWSFGWAVVFDRVDALSIKAIAAVVWQLSAVGALGWLLFWPGTQGPNRYGLRGR